MKPGYYIDIWDDIMLVHPDETVEVFTLLKVWKTFTLKEYGMVYHTWRYLGPL